ncbi:SOSEKI2 [Hibiscus trionum]|uniref:SOSEKI2 n=1 Tax=Hibiscus trionum TaxID=183268 RepID=A0A9W7IZH2_HIBTR|nr:SOSEKI2 [Hibiscus trionum]
MNGRSRIRARESSPDRAKVCMQQQQQQPKAVKPIRKVQVVYYLTRNGQLEHPHYMEVTHLVNQPLRLRDVMERLTALRGKGMPSLYSWSCKRTYKNGFVWNDLADNDIIPPSDGAEYVLKGSELVDGCSERLQQIQISKRGTHFQEPNLHPKQKSSAFAMTRHRGGTYEDEHEFDEDEEEEEEEEEEEYELDEEKPCYTSSTTPHSRFSRGVSTDELEYQETNIQKPQQHSSSIISEKQDQSKNTTSKRFEDGDPVANASASGRNSSVLLQLIACGNLAVNKAKNMPSVKQPVVAPNNVVKKSENLHRGVVCKSAVKAAEDDQMISCMSENPRFGNLQAEEKEYFSGSIVESMNSENRVVVDQPLLKKSNSYKEERSCKAALSGTMEEEQKDKAVKGNCIPRKKLPKQTRKMRVD